ncbi:MAG: hypothetical protein J0G94_13135 [Sphingomonadales bacterium]|nr:hypothetical protein [Sphingomonadales bacterium]
MSRFHFPSEFLILYRPTLAAIITAVRAGGLKHAQAMFEAGGYEDRFDDPAALAVKGRLLKSRAILQEPERQREAFAAAASSYAAADRLSPQPYTRINVATLSWLAGDRATGRAMAQDLLIWLESNADIAETPYFLAATRAEALTLLEDYAGANAALGEAIVRDPQGWEDHASTIRQLELILEKQGGPTAWLDRHRPPRSVYFSGHLGVAVEGSEPLTEQVRRILEEEQIGFGFGALAAGADLVIAECLLERGAELHLILPNSVEDFIAQSIAPYDRAWRARFYRCLAAASTVRCETQLAEGYQPLGMQLASDVAMGSALLHARRLASEAVQLAVIDTGPGEFGSGLETARCARAWRQSGGRQHLIRWPRTASVIASGAKTEPEGRTDLRLAALLHISFDGLENLDDRQFARAVDELLVPMRALAAQLPIVPDLVLPAGNARIAAFPDPRTAWAYARALLTLPEGALPLRLAAHYGVAHKLDNPSALVGRTLGELARIAEAALPGVLTTSETFADALQLERREPPHVEHVGETGPIALFTITERAA